MNYKISKDNIANKKEIKSIVSTIYRLFNINENAEITLECNPDDVDEKKLIELRDIGINRLSIGVQSFDNTNLKLMNR